MNQDQEGGARPADPALVNQAASHLGPTGFDPSRDLKPGSQGWIRWVAGPRPVAPETLVDIRWYNGAVSRSLPAAMPASPDLWEAESPRAGQPYITAYKLATDFAERQSLVEHLRESHKELHGCMIRRSGATCEVRKEYLSVALDALASAIEAEGGDSEDWLRSRERGR